MQGSIGEKLGEGVFATVHAWAPGQAVKIFRPNIPTIYCWHEAQMTHAVFAAGGPGPRLFGVALLNEGFAMVLAHLDGPTLLQRLRAGTISRGEAGAIMADLLLATHKTSAPRGVPSLRESVEYGLRRPDGAIPRPLVAGVRALIDRLPSGDALCHSDPHPGNVVMAAEGVKLIDWMGAVRAPAALDLACAHFLLSEVAPEQAEDPERPRALNRALQAEYARLSGVSPEALTAEIERFMPITYFRALSGGAFSAWKERLIRQIETAL